MTTETKLSDATKLEDVIASPRALKALTDKGYRTVGDIRSLKDVQGVFNVGKGTLAALEEAGVPAERGEVRDDEIEEGEHNIVLRSSRYAGFVIRILAGDVLPAIHQGARPRVIEPHAVYFKDGAAVLSRKDWLIRKHVRNKDLVAAEMAKPASEAPWRREAIAYLRSLGSHRRGDFQILE